jgi:hypothetical protein
VLDFGTTYSNVSRCVLAVDVNSLYSFFTSIRTKLVIGHGKDLRRFVRTGVFLFSSKTNDLRFESLVTYGFKKSDSCFVFYLSAPTT